MTSLCLSTKTLSECLNILNLCHHWVNIEYINLSYQSRDLTSESDIIEKAIKSFIGKVGHINTLIIKYDE